MNLDSKKRSAENSGLLFFCQRARGVEEVRRLENIWINVERETGYPISVMTETRLDKDIFDSLKIVRQAVALDEEVEKIDRIGYGVVERYSRKYISFCLQKLRIPANFRGGDILRKSPLEFSSLLCKHLQAVEHLIESLQPRAVVLTDGQAFNNPVILIIDAVCQLKQIQCLYIARPAVRTIITDNLYRCSAAIEAGYQRRITGGLTEEEKEVGRKAISSYVDYKKSGEFNDLVSRAPEKFQGLKTLLTTRGLAALARSGFREAQEQIYRRLYHYDYSLEWEGLQETKTPPSEDDIQKTDYTTSPYILLLLNKPANYRTTFLTPFQSNLQALIRNVAISVPFTHTLVIREHPGLRFRDFETTKEAYKLGNIRFAREDADLFDLIGAADVVVTLASSSFIDALVMAKPVITLSDPSFMVCEDSCGPIYKLKKWDDLAELLETCRTSPLSEESVLSYFISFLENTAASDDNLDQPDWPSKARADQFRRPWYSGSHGSLRVAYEISKYVNPSSSRENFGGYRGYGSESLY